MLDSRLARLVLHWYPVPYLILDLVHCKTSLTSRLSDFLKDLLVHWNCSHFFAIWNRVFSFSSATGLIMKRTNPGEMLQDWEPMGVPPLRTTILRNPVPYLIVVHRKTSLSSRLSWIVDDQKLAESRE